MRNQQRDIQRTCGARRAFRGARPTADLRPWLILYLSANPEGASRLAVDQECAAIERELRISQAPRRFELRSKWAVTIDEVMRHLNDLQPDVIHFSAHGGPGALDAHAGARDAATVAEVPRGEGALCLQDERGQLQLVSARAMAMMINSASRSAKLVVLNACYSDSQAGALCEVVDCVVGMSGAIADAAALAFSVGFYRALANSNSVSNAMAQAVATLAAKQMLDENRPRCQTRDGVDADDVVFGPAGVWRDVSCRA